MGGLCSTDGGQDRALAEKTEEMRPLGKPGCRWENIIKMDLKETGCGGGIDWVDKDHDWDRWRVLVIPVMNLRVP